jgi:hypothetical protein
MSKQEEAFKLFDAYNRQSPDQVVWEGTTYPAEYFYALRLHAWVQKLDPNAPEPLLLASRCQHIGRWEIPRSTYPEGRVGYLKWRSDLAKYHAQKAAELLLQAGYSEAIIGQVTDVVLKKKLKSDPDVQTMENALCLVFLEFQYEDFIVGHSDEKVIDILQKTWAKMTAPGREAALTLSFSERGTSLIQKALA